MLNGISSQLTFKGISRQELESRLTLESIKGVQHQENTANPAAPIATKSINDDYYAQPKEKSNSTGLWLTLLGLIAAAGGIGYAAHKGKIPDKYGGKQLTEWSNTIIDKSRKFCTEAHNKGQQVYNDIEKRFKSK